MLFRRLGRTGVSVSAVAVGTVALGIPYGIVTADSSQQPREVDAIALLRHAADCGVTLFDTAPAYGTAEALLGEAIGRNERCLIATKVTVPEPDAAVANFNRAGSITTSLNSSRRALRRERLDIVQIHNATPATLSFPDVRESLEQARENDVVRFLGASVYTEAEALAVINAGWIDILQVPFSILDQRIMEKVLDASQRAGVGVVTRSALLKGALTPRAHLLPAELAALRVGADRARVALGVSLTDLPQAAIRFCLTEPRVASVLVGVSTVSELDEALKAELAGPLSTAIAAGTATLALDDDLLIDPRRWPES